MPMQTNGVGTPRQDLMGAFHQFDPSFNNMIAEEILPAFEVDEYAGDFGVVPVEAFTTDYGDAVRRAPKAARSRSSWSPGADEWKLREYSHGEAVDQTEARIYGSWFRAEEVAAERVAEVLHVRREREVAALVHNTTTFPLSGSTGLSITNEWDDSVNAVPVDDIAQGIDAIRTRVGLLPMNLEISFRQWQALSNAEQILERLKYTSSPAGRLGLDELARALAVNKVVVGGGVYNSANPGAAAASMGNIWSDEYAFLYVPGGGDLRRPQLGRTFRLNDNGGLKVASYEDEDINSVIVYAEQHLQHKLIYAACGYLFGNVITI
jgi:hypothetical protein